MIEGIQERLAAVRRRIEAAAARSGRPSSAVTLVAVSKTMPAAAIREAVSAGVKILGENRVQEAREKIEALPGAAEWHLIGHLQTNKAKLAVGLFGCIHSLDSVRLAEELDGTPRRRDGGCAAWWRSTSGRRRKRAGSTQPRSGHCSRRHGGCLGCPSKGS